jgi:hypothetical protein
LAEELINSLTINEFWFLLQMQDAMAVAAGGQREYDMPWTTSLTACEAQGARYDISGTSVI